MEIAELLRVLTDTLDKLSLKYFITGSMATFAYGEPRLTNDIDVVVELPADRAAAFCQAFPPDQFYLSGEAVKEAIQSHHQFNILHPASGLKVDVFVASPSDFDRSRMKRAREVAVSPDLTASFASPEDVILKKMVYFQEGASDKHLRDIGGMLRVRGERLDRDYIETWASRLGVNDIWQSVLKREHQA